MTLTHYIRDFVYYADLNEVFFIIIPIKNLVENLNEFHPKTYRLRIFPSTMEGEENYINKIFFSRIL